MERTKSIEFVEACKPLMKWLNENCNPHVSCIITPTSVELVSSEVYQENITEFLVD